MDEQLVAFETATLAEEKGFNWGTRYFTDGAYIESVLDYEEDYFDQTFIAQHNKEYDGPIYLLPSQSTLQKWLREEHEVHICVRPALKEGKRMYWLSIYNYLKDGSLLASNIKCFDSYEQAIEEGLQKVLKVIK